MRTIAIVNQKGGCGKTTTAVNLGSVLAASGRRVLIVDMDPQSHCAACLGVPEGKLEWGIGEVLREGPASRKIGDGLLWEVMRNLWLAPSTVRLAQLESPNDPIAVAPDRDRRLSKILDVLSTQFDWCLVDCPPHIGLLTFNAVRAADEVLIPVETGYLAMKGSEKQEVTIESASRYMGRELPIRVLPTMHRPNSRVAGDVIGVLQRRFGERLLPVPIREHEILREAAVLGQSIAEYAPGSEAAGDFRSLAQWLEAHPISVMRNATLSAEPGWSIPDEGAPTEADVETVGVGEVASPWGIGGDSPTLDTLGDRELRRNERMAEVMRRMEMLRGNLSTGGNQSA